MNLKMSDAGCPVAAKRDSESLPLLIPEEGVCPPLWKPMNKEELERSAGGAGWKKLRSRLVFLFWVGWVIVLGAAVAVIVQSPRAAAPSLQWWQRDVFYRLQPALMKDADASPNTSDARVSHWVLYLKSLGIGAVILNGLFQQNNDSQHNVNVKQHNLDFKQLITESHKSGIRVILELCGLDILNQKTGNDTEVWDVYIEFIIKYWLEQGVSGFELCDTDAAFSEEILMKWNIILEEFDSQDDERILMLRQTRANLPIDSSNFAVNESLVEMVTKSLVPLSGRALSPLEVTEVMEANLQVPLDTSWPSWTVGGSVPDELQRAILVLMMTLPGTPVITHGDEFNPVQGVVKPLALFHSLSSSRAHEEALHSGTFTFLPEAPPNSTRAPPLLAFLRSWGCSHFLVVLNLGSDPHALSTLRPHRLPDNAIFITSSGLDRIGPVLLQSVMLQPHEAIVLKFISADNKV